MEVATQEAVVENKQVWFQNISVPILLVVSAICFFFAAGFWASNVNTKVDSVAGSQQKMQTTLDNIADKVNAKSTDISVLQVQFTALQQNTNDIKQSIDILSRKIK